MSAHIATQANQQASQRDIVRELEDHGVKATAQRVRVAELLMSVPTHMTAEQILAAVRRGGERVSKATVYNTLKVLAQRGLVRQIHLDPDARSTIPPARPIIISTTSRPASCATSIRTTSLSAVSRRSRTAWRPRSKSSSGSGKNAA